VLQQLTGEHLNPGSITSNEARADISARSFWCKGQLAFCDVRVFNPLAKRYLNQSLTSAYKTNESEKKRNYNERIIHVDRGSFTPLVFSALGGMSRECSTFFSHAAELMVKKRNMKVKSLVGSRQN